MAVENSHVDWMDTWLSSTKVDLCSFRRWVGGTVWWWLFLLWWLEVMKDAFDCMTLLSPLTSELWFKLRRKEKSARTCPPLRSDLASCSRVRLSSAFWWVLGVTLRSSIRPSRVMINVTPPMLSAASTLCSFVVSKRRWNWRRVTKNLKAGWRISAPRPRTTSSTSWHLSRSPLWPTINTWRWLDTYVNYTMMKIENATGRICCVEPQILAPGSWGRDWRVHRRGRGGSPEHLEPPPPRRKVGRVAATRSMLGQDTMGPCLQCQGPVVWSPSRGSFSTLGR